MKTWENNELLAAYEMALQISSNIENMLESEQIQEASIIPTEKLYDLACLYVILFDKLQKHELINSGYSKNKHNKLKH